jgi:predicted DNA-binding protein (UPF0251 family)
MPKMSEQDFLAIAAATRLTSRNREAARLHFVEDYKKTDAALEVGISKQRMSQVVQSFEAAQDKMLEKSRTERATEPQLGINHVLAINGSYAVAVHEARQMFGDETEIRTPLEGETHVGEVIARTDFHLVQSKGRGTVVVHELAKLDRVPPVGKAVAIEYDRDRATVKDRAKDKERELAR